MVERRRDLSDEENESLRRYANELYEECDSNASEAARRLGMVSSGFGRILARGQGTSRKTAELLAEELGIDVEEVLGHQQPLNAQKASRRALIVAGKAILAALSPEERVAILERFCVRCGNIKPQCRCAAGGAAGT